MKPVIEFQDVTKCYKNGESELVAVDHASFVINEGEFVAVTGKSGSGKSTMLNLMGALDTPTSGTVLLEGEPLNAMSDKKLSEMRRRRIGFVFQKYQLLEEYSVWDNICLPFSIDHRKPDKEYIESLLEAFGIAEKRDMHPNQLSGGQQQRVAIARAIAHRPAILLADEPTGNLDSETGLEVMRLLKLSQEKYGQTIVLITHDPDIAEWADRRIHIVDGKICRFCC